MENTTFLCPSCAQLVAVPPAYKKQEIRCPQCREAVAVPDSLRYQGENNFSAGKLSPQPISRNPFSDISSISWSKGRESAGSSSQTFGASEVLTAIWNLVVSRHLLDYLVIVAIALAPFGYFYFLNFSKRAVYDTLLWSPSFEVPFHLLSIVLIVLAAGALVKSMSDLYQEQPVSLAVSFLTGLRRIFAIGMFLVLSLVLLLAYWLVSATIIALGEVVLRSLDISQLGIIAGIAIGVWLTIRFLLYMSVAMPAIVVEDMTGGAGMRRSIQLTRGHLMQVFPIAVAVHIPVIVLFIALVILGGILRVTAPDWDEAARSGVLVLVWCAALAIVWSATSVAVYWELRAFEEPLELEELAKAFD